MSAMNISPTNGKISMRGIIIGLIPSIVIDGLLPFLVYTLLQSHTTQLVALSASAIPPIISNIISTLRNRHLDAFGVIILLGIVVSIVAIFFGGDPKLLLIKESFVTVALGVACLFSLLLPKPLMFYISKHFATGGNAAKFARFDSLWHYPSFRKMSYSITILWGIALIGEFLLRIVLVYTLTVQQVLLIAPIIFNITLVGLILWTVSYSFKVAKRGKQLSEQAQTQALS